MIRVSLVHLSANGSGGGSRRVALRAQVHGTMRRTSYFNTTRLEDPRGPEQPRRFQTHYADLCDSNSLVRVLSRVRPDELYNLGAQSHVKVSYDMPEFTTDVDGLGMHVLTVHCSLLCRNDRCWTRRRDAHSGRCAGTLRLLEAIRTAKLERVTRFFQASTSDLFGHPTQMPQTEETPFQPRSPYAVAKLFAFATVVNFREAFGMYAVNGILYNHESSRRGTSSIQVLPQLALRSVPRPLCSVNVGGRVQASTS